MPAKDNATDAKLLDTTLSAAKRVARIAWLDCADGATRRALACESHDRCPYGPGICRYHSGWTAETTLSA